MGAGLETLLLVLFPAFSLPRKFLENTVVHPAPRRTLLVAFQDVCRALGQFSRQAAGGTRPRTNRQQARSLQRFLYKHRGWATKLFAVVALGGLVAWNCKLMLALGVGTGVMGLVYLLQKQNWQAWIDHLRRWCAGPQRLLLLSVASGGLAMLGTYMTVSIWEDAHSLWLASSLILLGGGMLALLLVLTTLVMGREGDRFEVDFEQVLDKLAHPEPLKRLLAVRQLQRLIDQHLLESDQQRLAEQAFQLLLHQETEPAVREALLHSLQPRLIPLNLKPRRSGTLRSKAN